MEVKINQIETQNKNPKKRVLFIITQSEFGGAQRFLYELVTRLDKEEYEILIAADSLKESEFINSLEQKGIKTKRFNFLKREINPLFDLLGIIEIIKLINNFKPHYLHLNSSKAGVLGSIAGSLFKNLKIIYRIGGWSFNDPGPLWKKKIFIAAERITAKLKDIIVVNNKNDFEQALKLNIKPRQNLKLIYNGIDPLKTEFLDKEEARLHLFKKLSKDHGKIFQAEFLIGTVANFYETKGLTYLIDAVHLLNKSKLQNPNYKIILIGDGTEREKLESKIKNYGLEQDIILTGQIPEAYKYKKAFDLFVLPSVKEGMPWVVLEAMAAKLPIIATKVGALPEIIEDGKNGILVEPKNPSNLAQAINYVLQNERIRQELSLEAHQTVLFKFPIEKMIRETEALFQ